MSAAVLAPLLLPMTRRAPVARRLALLGRVALVCTAGGSTGWIMPCGSALGQPAGGMAGGAPAGARIRAEPQAPGQALEDVRRPDPASAGGQALQIMPIRVDLKHGQMATTVMVTNKGSARETIQLRPFAWTEAEGADRLSPTDLLSVSPPMTRIDPGQTQVFRLVLRRPAGSVEECYRLLFDQLPPAAPPGAIRVALRLSVPVFAASGARPEHGLAWGVVRDAEGALLTAANHGTLHERIIRPEVTPGAGPALAVPAAGAAYILPGAARSWRIEGGARLQPGSTVRLTALSDQGPVDAAVHVSGP